MDHSKILDVLFKHGIPTYTMALQSPIPTTNEAQLIISKQIPQQVGLIFGVYTYTDTVTPSNNPLITATDATNLYLVLKDGPTEFFQPIRLDSLMFTNPGFPNVDSKRYLDVLIPGTFDLSTSFYANPTGIVSAAAPELATNIMLGLWYISTESYLYLINNKIVDENALRFIKAKMK